MLQRDKREREEAEVQIQYRNYCLEVAEERAWGLEQKVKKLEVELASRNPTPLTDQGGQQ